MTKSRDSYRAYAEKLLRSSGFFFVPQRICEVNFSYQPKIQGEKRCGIVFELYLHMLAQISSEFYNRVFTFIIRLHRLPKLFYTH